MNRPECAEAGGFEPPVQSPVRQFSKLLVSATHPNFLGLAFDSYRKALSLKCGAKVQCFFGTCKFFGDYFLKKIFFIVFFTFIPYYLYISSVGTNSWYSRYQRLVLWLPTLGTEATNAWYCGYHRLVLKLPTLDTQTTNSRYSGNKYVRDVDCNYRRIGLKLGINKISFSYFLINMSLVCKIFINFALALKANKILL